MVAFGSFVGVGIVLLALMPGMRVLALVGAAQLICALGPRQPVAAYALAACWPALLALGDLLGRRQVLRGPTVALLSVHQGLLLYCFTHFVPLS